jgi:hypothetical protein
MLSIAAILSKTGSFSKIVKLATAAAQPSGLPE